MERRFIGVKEFAEYLGISVNTVYAWVNQRKIPYCKIGKLVKFDLRKIEDWLKEKQLVIVQLSAVNPLLQTPILDKSLSIQSAI